MDATDVARALVVRLCAMHGKESRAGQALLGWARDHRDLLWQTPDAKPRVRKSGEKRLGWQRLIEQAPALTITDNAIAPSIDTVAEVMDMSADDHALLLAGVALRRLHPLSNLRARLVATGCDIGEIAALATNVSPAQASTAFRQSLAVRTGLLRPMLASGGGIDLEVDWLLDRLLGQAVADRDQIVSLLVGSPQSTVLLPSDFAEQGEAFGLLSRLLSGALASGETGINILLHGPPGTGKTEFARAIAASASAKLHGVGESDEFGDEPSRFDRLAALRRAQHVLGRGGRAVLLFDEMEDLIGDAAPAFGTSRISDRAGSKLFVNRLLENNSVPVIWTTNAVDNIDTAHLRRMSFVLGFDHPSPKARSRIIANLAAQESVALDDQHVFTLIGLADDAASVARIAMRTARIAGGDASEAVTISSALLRGLRQGRRLPSRRPDAPIDIELIESDPPIREIFSRLANGEAGAAWSLLMTGPPGTGKTAFARHLAREIDRPLLTRKTSDLLSKWVGGTEENIAHAFSEARDKGAVLLFDEVDSLLLDRRDAVRSWEITQVNELLTWMDDHPLPVLAATNHEARLDPAALRRFVFKVRLSPLERDGARRAFSRFFGKPAPAALDDIAGLALGDFAVVQRQLKFGGNMDVLDALRREAEIRPGSVGRIGF